MPRVLHKSNQHNLQAPYPAHYLSNLPTLSPPPSSSSSQASSSSPSRKTTSSSTRSTGTSPDKKKYVCLTCDRGFTTSGHLARHTRVHTGERNHKCPFPGCETRCSRQDNLHQHYRIHLSPGSRRSSARSAMAKAMNNGSSSERSGNTSSSGSTTSSALSSARATPVNDSLAPSPPLPPLSPPPLEQARLYHITPPDSPPPLAQATLPATLQMQGSSSRSTSSPQASYSNMHQNVLSLSPPISLHSSPSHSIQLSYRQPHSSYPEQQQFDGYNSYISTAPSSVSHSPVNNGSPTQYSTYPSPEHEYAQSSSLVSNGSIHQIHTRNISSTSHMSRHSISHIANNSYPSSGASTTNPPSPVSSHSIPSHTSGPSTPIYPVFTEESNTFQSVMSQSHLPSSTHNNYQMHGARFDSPPPILAPIQERYIRREDRALAQQTMAYIHQPQPQPLTNDFAYHQSIGMGHGMWKTENHLRRGMTTLVQ
ncbi:hypothetical protein FA15DRAFT_625239 [Coprinopsis marcescibilis]|uniref:C2H2-type domain-containing protein n=1 Tax=Coprinopsis marcescibilis TaxID=230819 RepID=A0A5C3KK95_COPMA|nr:hypothetical protein FA15DRAFT_625239 [Coprinopsis marcescibilis]